MATLFDLIPPERDKDSPQLNDAQRRAVEHGEGPLLVIAGAGTGKTRVITERIRHLLASNPELPGESILGLTFTKKAAGEMKGRVLGAMGERAAGVTLATFHSFCETLVTERAPGRRVLDKVDHWILLRQNLARLQLKQFRRLADPGQFLNDFIEFFSRCQDELVSSEDYQRYADKLAADFKAERGVLDEDLFMERVEEIAEQQEIARAYRASEELLREKNCVSFGSLITGAVELLQGDRELRELLQQRYLYILVDEFQDTNIAQMRLLELLTGEHRNILAVGDNDQAIYRFRGASFGSLQIFLERFAGWKAGQDSSPWRLTLSENYRSTPNILRVATQVIGLNAVSADFPKKKLTAVRAEGQRARIVELAHAADEARWVADELERLHGAGQPWRDFAILYRQHVHRAELVRQLARRQIPFVIVNLSILEHPLVRDVLAYLRLIAHPSDDIACARVLAAPAWGLEASELVRLAERTGKKRGTSLYEALEAPQSELPFVRSTSAVAELLRFLRSLRVRLKRAPAEEIFEELVNWLEVPQRTTEEDRRYLQRLAEFIKEWSAKSATRGLTEFLDYLEFYEQAGGTLGLENEEDPRNAVKLMTVHAAKGLEFAHVFILRVNRGMFPANERPRTFEFPVELMKDEKPEANFHIQEERRLFYVALTRAQERLTITTLAEKRGKIPQFIEDILMDAGVKRRDILQMAPALPPEKKNETPREKPPEAELSLFPAPKGPAKIFSRVAEWAETFRPPVPVPLKLSPSAVENYRACPQKYLFSALWCLREGPRATLSFGSVMHTVVKRFIGELRRGNRVPFEEVQRMFETEWLSAGFEDDYQEAEYKKDGLEQLRVFHASVLKAPPEVLQQEKAFELPLDHAIVIAGRMDQINSLGGDAVEIVDYKTGKPKTRKEADKDLQLSLYALAAREVLGLEPAALVFHSLRSNDRCVTTRDAKRLDEAVQIVQETAADIRAGEFEPLPGSAFICKSCVYRPICPAHEEEL